MPDKVGDYRKHCWLDIIPIYKRISLSFKVNGPSPPVLGNEIGYVASKIIANVSNESSHIQAH